MKNPGSVIWVLSPALVKVRIRNRIILLAGPFQQPECWRVLGRHEKYLLHELPPARNRLAGIDDKHPRGDNREKVLLWLYLLVYLPGIPSRNKELFPPRPDSKLLPYLVSE